MLIAKITNNEDGIEAIVSQIGAAKFSVALRDIDADEFVTTILIYDNLDKAMAKAKEVAN
jgi:hypothetical protein